MDTKSPALDVITLQSDKDSEYVRRKLPSPSPTPERDPFVDSPDSSKLESSPSNDASVSKSLPHEGGEGTPSSKRHRTRSEIPSVETPASVAEARRVGMAEKSVSDSKILKKARLSTEVVDPAESAEITPSPPRRRRKSSAPSLQPREINQKVREIIRQPLSLEKHQDDGIVAHLYVHAVENRPVVCKVGISKQIYEARKNQIQHKCGLTLKNLVIEEFSLAEARRLESLIKAELAHFLVQPGCRCKVKSIIHEEYFRIPDDVMEETAARWVRFLRMKPYSEDGTLSAWWQFKMAPRKDVVIEEHEEHGKRHRRWSEFVDSDDWVDHVQFRLDGPKKLMERKWMPLWLLCQAFLIFIWSWPSVVSLAHFALAFYVLMS